MLVLASALTISTPTLSAPKWSVHYYGSVGAAHNSLFKQIDYTDDGSPQFNAHEESIDMKKLSRFGIQSSVQLSDTLSLTTQAVVNSMYDFAPTLEWAYLTYDITRNTRIRLGKQRRPLYLFSDVINITNAFLWPSLPPHMYYESRGLNSSNDSIDVHYQNTWGNLGYSLEAYYNRHSSGIETYFGPNGTYTTKNSFGFVFNIEKDNLEFRLSAHRSTNTFKLPTLSEASDNLDQIGFSEIADMISIKNRKTIFNSLGLTYYKDNWTLLAEITNFYMAQTFVSGSIAAYLSAQREFGKVKLGLTLGKAHTRKSNRGEIVQKIEEARQDDNTTPTQHVVLSGVHTLIDHSVITDNYKFNLLNISARYQLQPNVAIKAHYEHEQEQENRQRDERFMLSMDFIY